MRSSLSAVGGDSLYDTDKLDELVKSLKRRLHSTEIQGVPPSPPSAVRLFAVPTNIIYLFSGGMTVSDHLYKTETSKSTVEFAGDLSTVVKKYGFVIHNEHSMDMARSFGQHGAEVANAFDLHMMQLCKPEKAAISL